MAITGTLRGRALIRKQPSYYTAEQALQYLQRVGWSEGDYTVQDLTEGRFPANLENLEVIVRRHYLSFANDTTLMHYSAGHYLDITPEATFKRLVSDRKGGTYCYGHHNLMLGVIRALGYRSYSGIARMNFGFFMGGGAEAYQAYGHMVLFVQLGDGQGTDPAHTWLVDCAPGPPVPTLPIPLSDDPANVLQNAVPGEYNRLTRGFASSSSLVPPGGPDSPYTPEQAAEIKDVHAQWQMEYRPPGKADFFILYQVSEQEFTTLDYNVQHYSKMFKPKEDVFSDDVVAFRYVLGDDDTGRRITERTLGRWALFRGVFKKRLGDKILERIYCKSEEERVAVLRKYFDITIEDEDIAHIKGTAACWEKKLTMTAELDAMV